MKRFVCIVGAFLFASLGMAQLPVIRDVPDGQQFVQKKDAYGRGHVTPKNIKELHAKSWAAHSKRLKSLPDVTATEWDCSTLGLVGPVQDQGSCGSCWDVSACGVLDSAFIKAGYFKNDGTLTTSAQYILDCTQNGGCDGDDASTVTGICKSTGIPTTQDYGAYRASPGNCKTLPAGTKFWKIDQQGYCSQSDGVASTQSIKNAIAAYGPISSAVDAGGFNNYSSGIMPGNGGNIDHDVSITGWKTVNNVTIWKVKNQWSAGWGEKGFCWIPESKWSIGYSALWVHAVPIGPTPPPPAPATPPYMLFEGSMTAQVAVGVKTGYTTLPLAEADARAIATKDNQPVMIHDFKGVMIETVQPVPPTITFTLPGFIIPGQNITVQGRFGTYTGRTADVAIPAKVITVPFTK